MDRRPFLASLLAAVVAGAWSGGAPAQAVYPNKPIRLSMGFPPGGGIDFTTRALQPDREAPWGSRSSSNTSLALAVCSRQQELARAAPDGYSLLIANT